MKDLNIAVIGSGISGLSAAWLLSRHHRVTLFEKDDRLGGHTNTVSALGCPVDTGFIVYNEHSYPNLTAFFDCLGVETQPSDMSFAVSAQGGKFEYSGSHLAALFGQRRNVFRPRFWSMFRDILRFYREAPLAGKHDGGDGLTIGQYLAREGYSEAFCRDHLLPMGAAIWSAPVDMMMDYPVSSFIGFCENHGLLQLSDRPVWRTVCGGSKVYVDMIVKDFAGRIVLNSSIARVRSGIAGAIEIELRDGSRHEFDHVVIATHANNALDLLDAPTPAEKRLLGAFSYQRNIAILHTDESLMPRNRRVWSSWNYISDARDGMQNVCVTYWMNRLQNLPVDVPLFVTLNPIQPPREGTVLRSFIYDHPVYDHNAIAAQRLLWNIQGVRNIWFCGSYFGHGFHEDGLQAGLAVAEDLGGVRRPWSVTNESGRIFVPQTNRRVAEGTKAA